MKKSTLIEIFCRHPKIGRQISGRAGSYLVVDVSPGILCGLQPQTRRSGDRVHFLAYAGIRLDGSRETWPDENKPFDLFGLVHAFARILGDPHPMMDQDSYGVPFFHSLPAAEAYRDLSVDVCEEFAKLLQDRDRLNAAIAHHGWQIIDPRREFPHRRLP